MEARGAGAAGADDGADAEGAGAASRCTGAGWGWGWGWVGGFRGLGGTWAGPGCGDCGGRSSSCGGAADGVSRTWARSIACGVSRALACRAARRWGISGGAGRAGRGGEGTSGPTALGSAPGPAGSGAGSAALWGRAPGSGRATRRASSASRSCRASRRLMGAGEGACPPSDGLSVMLPPASGTVWRGARPAAPAQAAWPLPPQPRLAALRRWMNSRDCSGPYGRIGTAFVASSGVSRVACLAERTAVAIVSAIVRTKASLHSPP